MRRREIWQEFTTLSECFPDPTTQFQATEFQTDALYTSIQHLNTNTSEKLTKFFVVGLIAKRDEGDGTELMGANIGGAAVFQRPDHVLARCHSPHAQTVPTCAQFDLLLTFGT